MYESDGKPTHYLYYPTTDGSREPTGLLCLSNACPYTRQTILHNALRNGEFLAKLPCKGDMITLRKYLKG